jgi:hypothetical protein
MQIAMIFSCRGGHYIVVLLLVGLVFLTACGGLGVDEATPIPLPTSSLPGLVTIQPQLCRLAELPMLRVDQPQGDLLAWSPEGNILAYLAPETGSTWMVGRLMTVSEPAFASPVELASYVAGDLAWSPDGSRLAYLSLRRGDRLYSVGVAYPQGGLPQDMFPGEAARTDEWSSQKAVLGWEDNNRLRTQVSCGLDCVQMVEVNVVAATQMPLGDPTQRSWNWWDYTLNQPEQLPVAYQDFMQKANWAPGGARLVYLDARLDAWVVNLEGGTQFILDTGGYLAVSETDWSPDGRYLAVQAEDWLFIFSSDCP